jgi:hypothetical protein
MKPVMSRPPFVCEPLLLGGEEGGVAERLRRGPRAMPRHVRLGAADPKPGVVLGGGGMTAVGSRDLLERCEVRRRMRRRYIPPDIRPESHHQVDPSGRNVRRTQATERRDSLAGGDTRLEVELEEVMCVGPLSEDPELGQHESIRPEGWTHRVGDL